MLAAPTLPLYPFNFGVERLRIKMVDSTLLTDLALACSCNSCFPGLGEAKGSKVQGICGTW